MSDRRSALGEMPHPLPFAGTDEDLVVALRRGHPGAAEALFASFEPAVQRIVVRVLGLDPDVPDLVHDVFVAALENIGKLRDAPALRSWLESMAVFSARTHLRKRARRQWLGRLQLGGRGERSVPPPDPESNQAVAAVYQVLDCMPADERVAFALRFLEDRTVAEVANLTRASVRTTHRRLARAERRFIDAAMGHPALRDWLVRGGRWAARSSQAVTDLRGGRHDA